VTNPLITEALMFEIPKIFSLFISDLISSSISLSELSIIEHPFKIETPYVDQSIEKYKLNCSCSINFGFVEQSLKLKMNRYFKKKNDSYYSETKIFNS
jgi:hypothetical protein